MPSSTDANASLGSSYLIPGYDPSGHQYKVAIRITNLQTDTSVTPNIVYGDLVAALPGGVTINGALSLASEYPSGATPINATSGIVANAQGQASLPGTSGKTTYIKGFHVSGSGATVGLPVSVVIANLISANMSFIYCATAGALLVNTPLAVYFDEAIPASAVNTAITVTCPALGLGNTNNVVNAWGYQL